MLDATGQALVYVDARETSNEANIAGVLTFDEARRIAVKLSDLLAYLSPKRTPESSDERRTMPIAVMA